MTALNKIDLLQEPAEIDASFYPNAVPISALNNSGLEELREKVAAVLAESMERIQVIIPFEKSELVELFHRRGYVEAEHHESCGTCITGRIPRTLHGYYAPFASA